ncbi:MAG TPA: amylovoran biosynthesis protein AmsE [Prolixibacteraceae bacterium]|nr:amylovoran biosynthesis protein AmsE [Prolixibacteraceae bacterium]
MDQTKRNLSFSVLLSVYYKEKPEYLSSALESIWKNQTLKPKEIVIVKDGPLSDELDHVIDAFSTIAPIKCVSLDKNYGLGIALAKGLEACSNEIVARMDSDDIAQPDRFEKQVKFLVEHPKYDVVGSNIAEFNQSINDIVSFRKVPEQANEITSFAKRRNPMNHMTIVFRRRAVLDAGNYVPFLGYEDYYLWVRMFRNGSKFYNLQENLVFARIGNDMLVRRQGINFFFQELKLQKEFRRIGFINRFDYMLNLLFRATPRLFPIWGLKYVYKTLRK